MLGDKQNDILHVFFNKINLSKIEPDYSRRYNYNKNLTQRRPGYENAYKAMMKSSSSLKHIVDLCECLFENAEWEPDYGGDSWADICKGWKRLNSAKSKGPLIVAIDHVYDLQHNTDTVFNKLHNYYKDGFEWLKEALDFKKHIKNPFALYEVISPSLKPIAARILKKSWNTTKQDYQNSGEKNILTEVKFKELLQELLDRMKNERIHWMFLLEDFYLKKVKHTFRSEQNIKKFFDHINTNQSISGSYAHQTLKKDGNLISSLPGVSWNGFKARPKSTYIKIYQSQSIMDQKVFDFYAFDTFEFHSKLITWTQNTTIGIHASFSKKDLYEIRALSDKVSYLKAKTNHYATEEQCRQFLQKEFNTIEV